MGSDSVLPFLEYPDKWVVLLALTSNQGADDFQMTAMDNGERLFETVLRKSSEWGNPGNMMYVVGATRASMLKQVRELVPDHFLLIPVWEPREETCRKWQNMASTASADSS